MHTNGSLIDEETAKKLKQFDVLTTISIYSMKEQINDLITNKKGSLVQSLKGVRNTIKNKLDLHIFIVPLKHNVFHIKDSIIKLNQIGVNNFRILSLSPTGKAFDIYDNISLNKIEIEKLSNDLNYLNDNYDVNIECGFCTHQSLPELSYLKGHDQCYSGKNRVHIDSLGNVYPCTAASGRIIFSTGNIRNASIQDIWYESPLLQFIRRFHNERPSKCQNCTKYDECMGGCRVQMAYQYRDFTKVKPNCGGPFR
jgi:radical SAM protein with 4Fe4S-binding SPASM domain